MTGFELTAGSAALALVIGLIAAGIGGVAGGILTGGKHIGNELAAVMGSFYGPVGVVPGMIVGLLLLALVK